MSVLFARLGPELSGSHSCAYYIVCEIGTWPYVSDGTFSEDCHGWKLNALVLFKGNVCSIVVKLMVLTCDADDSVYEGLRSHGWSSLMRYAAANFILMNLVAATLPGYMIYGIFPMPPCRLSAAALRLDIGVKCSQVFKILVP